MSAILSNLGASTRERAAKEAIKRGLTRSDGSSVALSLAATDNERMRLIERESQLAALHQYADEASHAQGRLVLVSGRLASANPRYSRTLLSSRRMRVGSGRHVMVCLRPPHSGLSSISPPNWVVSCFGYATLTRNDTSYTALCLVNSAAWKLSLLAPSRTSTGLMRQRWIC